MTILYSETHTAEHMPEFHEFLGEVAFSEHGVPQWIADYYGANTDTDDQHYNLWQNTQKVMTDGVSQDGRLHLEEYAKHCQRSELPHTHIVRECESFPAQEPYTTGAPIHCSYTQVSIPYYRLPEEGVRWFKEDQFVAMIIGASGYHLNRLTKDFGLHYIWYNSNPLGINKPSRQDGKFELWGRLDRLPQAVDALQRHMTDTLNDIWENWIWLTPTHLTPVICSHTGTHPLPPRSKNLDFLRATETEFYDEPIGARGILQVRHPNGDLLFDGNNPWFLIEHISADKYYLDQFQTFFLRLQPIGGFHLRWLSYASPAAASRF